MAIQWFPGHMHLTKKAITERIKDTDVVIELLDEMDRQRWGAEEETWN